MSDCTFPKLLQGWKVLLFFCTKEFFPICIIFINFLQKCLLISTNIIHAEFLR